MCGHTGTPLVKHDRSYHLRLLEVETQNTRANLVARMASKKIIRGKDKNTAALLALFLGSLGMHRFYLEERGAGYLFLSWFTIFFIIAVSLTAQLPATDSYESLLIGLAWFLAVMPALIGIAESAQLFQMDDITFNLTYNIELVLNSIPPLPQTNVSHMDVFSMDVSDEPDELLSP